MYVKQKQIRFILFHFIPRTSKKEETSQTDFPGKPIKMNKQMDFFVCLCCLLFFSFYINYIIVLFYLNTFVVSPVFYLDFLYWFNKLHGVSWLWWWFGLVEWILVEFNASKWTFYLSLHTELERYKCEAQTFRMNCVRQNHWKRVYFSVAFIHMKLLDIFFPVHHFDVWVYVCIENHLNHRHQNEFSHYMHLSNVLCVWMCKNVSEEEISLIFLGKM